jgi:two-component system phosphate regulon sensor histidine kinase PhoR
MTLIAFLVGLAIGIGVWLWQQRRLNRRLKQMLGSLHSDASSSSMPIVSRLRQEITFANQQRELLEKKLEIRKHLLQIMPIGYLQVDEENQLLWCNEQAQQLLQINRWEPGQIRLLLELVRSYELDHLIEQTRLQQQPEIIELVFHPVCLEGSAMGSVRPLTLRASSWPLPQRQVGVFLENQQPLVDLTQSRDRANSDLAHELRTPLTAMRLVAEALQGRVEPPASRWVEQMLRETDRLICLVQEWLELSQMDKDPTTSLTLEPLELHSLLQLAWENLEPLAQQKQLSLAYQGVDSVWLEADPTRLTQVFINLFDNSIKHSPTKAEIRVEVSLLPATDELNCVQINIIDSGSGFAEADLPHVFERLYRGETSRHRQQTALGSPERLPNSSGSGLGLSIVQKIILAHGGEIQAQNHPKTGGAWLQISLPVTGKY